jgi:hypothetical protein
MTSPQGNVANRPRKGKNDGNRKESVISKAQLHFANNVGGTTDFQGETTSSMGQMREMNIAPITPFCLKTPLPITLSTSGHMERTIRMI